ncbi:hypothetical protein NDU88_004408 [Pleurodeles waltl]|uniref:Uncharacterized protein n=1 Tax=Pleurodeles waltl TaxID=8319 RepID=A0AAV7NJD1_PLEWA|nr:hypothetical protein NDU88_004408 [Pleurodeles waltl]
MRAALQHLVPEGQPQPEELSDSVGPTRKPQQTREPHPPPPTTMLLRPGIATSSNAARRDEELDAPPSPAVEEK